MTELKKEFKNYLDDLEKNIQNKDDLEYIKDRTTEFMDIVLGQMEYILNYKEKKIAQIEKIQKDIERKITLMQQDIKEIEEDIYIDNVDSIYDENDELEFNNVNENEYDFEIVCPYCDNEFLIDLDQENSEIECPQCNNIIELDWTGNTEEQAENKNKCGGGHCSNCSGCGFIEKDDEDDM
jgi:uncharacterized Zn-finger protein